jgi:hypothetical protein
MTSSKSYNLVQAAIGFLQLSRGETHLPGCLGYISAKLPKLIGNQVNLVAQAVNLLACFGKLRIRLGKLFVVLQLLIVKSPESVPKIFRVEGGHQLPLKGL